MTWETWDFLVNFYRLGVSVVCPLEESQARLVNHKTITVTSLKLTANAPENRPPPGKGDDPNLEFPIIFRCKLAVSFREIYNS